MPIDPRGVSEIFNLNRLATSLLVSVVVIGAVACTPDVGSASNASQNAQPPVTPSAVARSRLDLSGRQRVGVASFYAKMFVGREMADGAKMDPHGDNAASRTLPLGTTARVTNIDTGRSAVVTIEDRGPYVKGRIMDLSPTTAHEIGITQQSGIATVRVAPIAVPLPDGSIKRGVAAQDAKP